MSESETSDANGPGIEPQIQRGLHASPKHSPLEFIRTLFRERPTPEQLARLDSMKRILEPPKEGVQDADAGLATWLIVTKWREHFELARLSQKLELINLLYQQIANDDRVSVKTDFPTLMRDIRHAFSNPTMETHEWDLTSQELLATRITEYRGQFVHP